MESSEVCSQEQSTLQLVVSNDTQWNTSEHLYLWQGITKVLKYIMLLHPPLPPSAKINSTILSGLALAGQEHELSQMYPKARCSSVDNHGTGTKACANPLTPVKACTCQSWQFLQGSERRWNRSREGWNEGGRAERKCIRPGRGQRSSPHWPTFLGRCSVSQRRSVWGVREGGRGRNGGISGTGKWGRMDWSLLAGS